MANQCAPGALSRYYIDGDGASPRTIDNTSETYEFLSENIKNHQKIVGTDGIVGTRSQIGERTRLTSAPINGVLVSNTSPAEMNYWLPRILGGTPVTVSTTTTFPLGEGLTDFDMIMDKVNGRFRYNEVFVNRAIITGQNGQGEKPGFIQVALEVYAKTETDLGMAYTLPTAALKTTADYSPYTFDGDTTLSLFIDGDYVDVEMKWFQLIIDNGIVPRWVNSLTATSLCPQRRRIALRVGSVFTTTNSEYQDDLIAGVAGKLRFNIASTLNTEFQFPNLKAKVPTPEVPGKVEIMMPMPLVAYTLGTAKEMVVVNQRTP